MRNDDRLTRIARERLVRNAAERRRVHEAIAARRPLDAEFAIDRKLKRICAVTGVSRDMASAIAAYRSPAELGLHADARLGAERLQGRTTDFVGVVFVEMARLAANAVARIIYQDGQPLGSGFLVTPRLLLTNHHVIGTPEEARGLFAEFNYELDQKRQPRRVTRFALDPGAMFLTSGIEELDFTLVALGARVEGELTTEMLGFVPLLASDDKHSLGEFVNVIQHPEGDFKQVVVRENRLVGRLETVLHYEADTLPGSSGSPVFNDQWEVVALHHWGGPYTEQPQEIDHGVNEGLRISAIVRELRGRRDALPPARQALLDEALVYATRDTLPELEPATAARPGDRASTAIGEPRLGADGVARWTIPIEIAVAVGGTTVPAAAPVRAARAAAVETPVTIPTTDGRPDVAPEAAKPDPNYKKRLGYKPDFIRGHEIPLPKLGPEVAADVAKPMMAAADSPLELKYEHFSLVMSKSRRMAFFTACNINGARSVHIKRKEEALEPEAIYAELGDAEATEKWYEDPRLEPEAQCDQRLYDKQKPTRVFDRGHLVRREDPVWGTQASAQRANSDTFHFANCTPQQKDFNQRAQYWQGIENWILDNARADKAQVTVFTGPVFAKDDPEYRYVKVPMAFWKVVARVDDGELLVTAMLAEQSPLLKKLPEALRGSESLPFDLAEKLMTFEEVAQYQASVTHIEELTGLDFGSLREFDTFTAEGGEEALGGRRMRIQGFAEVWLEPRPEAARQR